MAHPKIILMNLRFCLQILKHKGRLTRLVRTEITTIIRLSIVVFDLQYLSQLERVDISNYCILNYLLRQLRKCLLIRSIIFMIQKLNTQDIIVSLPELVSAKRGLDEEYQQNYAEIEEFYNWLDRQDQMTSKLASDSKQIFNDIKFAMDSAKYCIRKIVQRFDQNLQYLTLKLPLVTGKALKANPFENLFFEAQKQLNQLINNKVSNQNLNNQVNQLNSPQQSKFNSKEVTKSKVKSLTPKKNLISDIKTTAIGEKQTLSKKVQSPRKNNKRKKKEQIVTQEQQIEKNVEQKSKIEQLNALCGEKSDISSQIQMKYFCGCKSKPMTQKNYIHHMFINHNNIVPEGSSHNLDGTQRKKQGLLFQYGKKIKK